MGQAAKALGITAGFLFSAGALAFAAGAAGISADEALQRLMEGNKRYIENQMTGQKLCDLKARESLAKGQQPYAIVLSCSDSRVPPEIIFDKGLGELFVVRVAGNVPDPVVLGSIEYAAEHLNSPLIVVLGHERCGAVTAAVDAKGKPEGNIGEIVKKIAPAVKQAKKEAAGRSKSEMVETAIDDNVVLVAESLTKQSAVLKQLVKEGKVKIVGAKYDLDDGKVSLMKLK
ncbi:carbonic anhydrase [Geobacter sp. DSM 9736]|uniref:carbonic anhydrase n=1 Tax=Geobacter sp. DSM 9736 TaxID=1277350 RepID=UPI000B4FE73D|nr:carbonic anhydrase [Geobacter sp. DSM 9736]SNB46080.1 carbonic anhydrase [Geobacter sp. DSM 9736]